MSEAEESGNVVNANTSWI